MGSGILIWMIIMIPCSALVTGIGIYALKREKPMWFWSGTEVSEEEITDIPAYNRANGIMWIVFSGIFWVSTLAAFASMKTAGLILIAGCAVGIPALLWTYSMIYARYRKDKNAGPRKDSLDEKPES